MDFHFENLEDVRSFMESELDVDINEDRVYISPRLNNQGQAVWVDLLREAIQSHDEEWLEAEIRSRRLLNQNEVRIRNGKSHSAKVPITAAETLSEGEFNRYYIRGLCLLAIQNKSKIMAYRGKSVSNPRWESEDLIGRAFDPQRILDDLRVTIGVDTAFGLPAGPNSGITAKLAQ